MERRKKREGERESLSKRNIIETDLKRIERKNEEW